MKMNRYAFKAVALAWSTLLFVGMGLVVFAQHGPYKKKRYEAQPDPAQYEQRMTAYHNHLNAVQQSHQQRMVRVQGERRATYYRYQQRYSEQMRLQQRRYVRVHDHNYRNDPYYRERHDHRYVRAGVYYQTNRYGIEHLQQAIHQGYAEGFQAGMADRQDNWRFDFQGSDAYIDASYGFNGYYVSLDDYSHYFREGFRRGYEDGYYRRYRYGRYVNGKRIIQAGVLAAILPFELLR